MLCATRIGIDALSRYFPANRILTNEAETERIQVWLSAQAEQALIISEWVSTEFSSALSIKARTVQIEPKDRTVALATYRQIAAQSFIFIPITSEHFRVAGLFADQYELGLRAGDALHLSVAYILGW